MARLMMLSVSVTQVSNCKRCRYQWRIKESDPGGPSPSLLKACKAANGRKTLVAVPHFEHICALMAELSLVPVQKKKKTKFSRRRPSHAHTLRTHMVSNSLFFSFLLNSSIYLTSKKLWYKYSFIFLLIWLFVVSEIHVRDVQIVYST